MPDKSVRNELLRTPSDSGLGIRISRNQLYFISFVVFIIILAVVFPFVDLKLQLMLILAPIVFLCVIYILMNPYAGIYLFFLFDYSRIDYFFPPLRPFRVAIILEVVTLLSWIFHLIRTRKHIVWHNFNWVYLAFLGVIGSTIFTAWNNRLAYNIFQSMAIYFMIFFISINVIDSLKRLNRLIWLLFIIHVFFAVKGIFGGGKAGGAFLGDENDFALAMNMMIPFAFFMFLDARSKLKKFSLLGVLVVLTLAVISSMSRGGWVGLMATMIFCVIKSRKIFVSFVIMIILTGAIISFAPQKYWSEVETITNTHEATAASRINYWKAAVRMFKDYPITGVGANNGGVRMPGYYKGPRENVTQWGRAFHGTLPQVLAELGFLGIFCYLTMVFLAIKYLNRISRRGDAGSGYNTAVFANSIMVSIISYLTSATFLSTAYYPTLWTLFTLTMVLVIITGRSESKINYAEESGIPDFNLSRGGPGAAGEIGRE